LTPEETRNFPWDWRGWWARPDQLAPAGDWSKWLILAGRGYGKTKILSEWVRELVDNKTASRIALVAPTAADVRDVLVEGPSGILACCPDWNKPLYEPSKRRVTFANGAVAITYSADEPDRLRGPQHDAAACFIAGTMISTVHGERAVEQLSVGDFVWTRDGLHRIIATSSRIATVGTVFFSNDRKLTGTAEHPVLTSHGWTRLSDLSKGSLVCVASALNSTVNVGTDTAETVITNIGERVVLDARTIKSALRREPVGNAEQSSRASTGNFAASVVSIWEGAGRARVFNLQVEGVPEYFANGILVHNCDELAAWRYPETWDMLMFGLRLGQNPRCAIATTPKPVKLLKELLAREGSDVIVTRGSTYENSTNLAPTFFKDIVSKYEGTRLGRQELLAELLSDVPNALWQRENLDRLRISKANLPEMRRIVVAIDPAATSAEGSDETGIIVAGIGHDKHGYVLDDLSGRYQPNQWARKAIWAYDHYKADRIIAEINNGGEMVEATLRTVNKTVSYKAVHATRGKVIRAEPIAALDEQGKIHHVGTFPVLEDQLCEFTLDFDRKTAGYSPDRLDARVWAFTELMPDRRSFFS